MGGTVVRPKKRIGCWICGKACATLYLDVKWPWGAYVMDNDHVERHKGQQDVLNLR
jgi:hypothetical protein